MRYYFSFVRSMVLLSVLACAMLSAIAEEKNSSTGTTSVPKKDDSKLSEPYVGKVQLARSLIGVSLHDSGGHVVGKVEDVALDIGQGKIQAVYVTAPTEPTSADKSHETIIVPFSAIKRPEKAGGNFTTTQMPMKDSKTNTSKDSEEANSKSQVILISKFPAIEIRNEENRFLGNIIDFALAQDKDHIAYVIFTTKKETKEISKDEKFYPIPLSAFVVKKDIKSWRLELPKDLLKNTPTFKLTELPKEVDGTWTEYVRVRYGRAILGGVLSENAETVNEKKKPE